MNIYFIIILNLVLTFQKDISKDIKPERKSTKSLFQGDIFFANTCTNHEI